MSGWRAVSRQRYSLWLQAGLGALFWIWDGWACAVERKLLQSSTEGSRGNHLESLGQHAALLHRYIGMVCVVLIGLGAVIVCWAVAARRHRPLHGAARFASLTEILRAGLMADHGILVGKLAERYLVFSGQQFVLLAAPTRSGKGVGVVIPNLLNFPDSAVVLDIKQENFEITAGFRASCGQDVFLFNPFSNDFRTHRYNPLDYISDDLTRRVGDILEIGTILYPLEGKDGLGGDAFWQDRARDLFLGIVLLICETPEVPRTMGEVLRQASGYGKKPSDYLIEVIRLRWEAGRPLSPDCVDALQRFLDNAEETRSSALATFNAGLAMWANPIVDAATSASDFSLDALRRERMTIYVGIAPNKLAVASPLINIFFSQLINLNVRERPSVDPSLRYQCLLLMDEFTAIGKVNVLAKAIGYIAGYNLRLVSIIQSLSQLESVYGPADARTMMTNHALQVLYTPREQKDANEYSEMLGYVTEKNLSVSRAFGLGRASGSSTLSDQRRALMLPQELKELPRERELIMLEGCKPILADKLCYYTDAELKWRVQAPPTIQMLDMQAYGHAVNASRHFNYIPPTAASAAIITPDSTPQGAADEMGQDVGSLGRNDGVVGTTSQTAISPANVRLSPESES